MAEYLQQLECQRARADGRSCEFAVVIADAWHKTGIAGLLMEALIRAARSHDFEPTRDPAEATMVPVERKL